jgi:hypothetical protein
VRCRTFPASSGKHRFVARSRSCSCHERSSMFRQWVRPSALSTRALQHALQPLGAHWLTDEVAAGPRPGPLAGASRVSTTLWSHPLAMAAGQVYEHHVGPVRQARWRHRQAARATGDGLRDAAECSSPDRGPPVSGRRRDRRTRRSELIGTREGAGSVLVPRRTGSHLITQRSRVQIPSPRPLPQMPSVRSRTSAVVFDFQ